MGRVLVVDDQADVRKAVRLILTKAGYDVVEADKLAAAVYQATQEHVLFKDQFAT
jgi:CheY-like chemotaxis protein